MRAVRNWPSHPVELYELSSDVGERVNVANKHVEKRNELLAEMLHWIDTIEAPIPTQRSEPISDDALGRETDIG